MFCSLSLHSQLASCPSNLGIMSCLSYWWSGSPVMTHPIVSKILTLHSLWLSCVGKIWAAFYKSPFNSLWPRDTKWHHRSWSILAQVIACCLMAPSHYLNQCPLRKLENHLSAIIWKIHKCWLNGHLELNLCVCCCVRADKHWNIHRHKGDKSMIIIDKCNKI